MKEVKQKPKEKQKKEPKQGWMSNLNERLTGADAETKKKMMALLCGKPF